MGVVVQQMAVSAKDLGVQLRNLRKKQGLTQVKLGQRVGLDQKKVSQLENGNPNMRVESIFRLLSALGCGIAVVPKEPPSAQEQDDW
jgi:HTH-type transcriptional regulator/antitoxin HipB